MALYSFTFVSFCTWYHYQDIWRLEIGEREVILNNHDTYLFSVYQEGKAQLTVLLLVIKYILLISLKLSDMEIPHILTST